MVAVLVAFIDKVNGAFTRALGEKIDILTLIAGGNQFLQAKKLEVVSKTFEEIAYARVIAVTEYRLTTEVLAVMPQLIDYVFKLSIELIFLGFLSPVQIPVCHYLLKRVT